MQTEKVPRNTWSILIRSWFPCSNDWKQSRWKSLSTMGCSCRWRSHLSFVRRRILLLQEPCHWENVLISSMEENNSRPLLMEEMEVGIEFVLYMVGMAGLLVVFLKCRKLRKRQPKSWEKKWDPLLTVLWRKTQKMAFKNSIYFVTDRSFAADSGPL